MCVAFMLILDGPLLIEFNINSENSVTQGNLDLFFLWCISSNSTLNERSFIPWCSQGINTWFSFCGHSLDEKHVLVVGIVMKSSFLMAFYQRNLRISKGVPDKLSYRILLFSD